MLPIRRRPAQFTLHPTSCSIHCDKYIQSPFTRHLAGATHPDDVLPISLRRPDITHHTPRNAQDLTSLAVTYFTQDCQLSLLILNTYRPSPTPTSCKLPCTGPFDCEPGPSTQTQTHTQTHHNSHPPRALVIAQKPPVCERRRPNCPSAIMANGRMDLVMCCQPATPSADALL